MKKRTKKLLALLLTAAMVTTAFAACGGGGDTASDDTATEDNAADDAEDSVDDAADDVDDADDAADDADEADGADDGDEVAEVDEDPASSTPREETLYQSGQQWDPINDFNPMSSNSQNWAIAQSEASRVFLYETLYMYNILDNQAYPLLAGGDYEWNDDQTELTVPLNPDATWSDGTDFTAADVVATFNAHVEYASPTGSEYEPYIDEIVAEDDNTVVFKAALTDDGRAANPLRVLDFLTKVYMMQEDYLNTVIERNNGSSEDIKIDVMDDCVVTGPYYPYFYNEQKVVYERLDDYWGQAESLWGKLPAPKYIAHNIFADNAAGDLALQQGEVDVSQQYTSEVNKLWEDGLPISTFYDEEPYQYPGGQPSIFFNVSVPGLDQVEVRKALAMAVDYEAIRETAMTNQSPSYSDIPRSLMNATDGEQAMVDQDRLADYQWDSKDIDGANALLDEAGIVDSDGDGIREYDGENLSFTASCPDGWSDWQASLEMLAAAGKEIGIEILTSYPTANVYYDERNAASFEITMGSLTSNGIANPYIRCQQFLSSEWNDLEVNAIGNFGRWENERADEILELIPYETDEATLVDYYTELSQIYLDEVPSFGVMYRPMVFHTVNETVWTGFPEDGDGTNIPPLMCTDGYGIGALYNIYNVE